MSNISLINDWSEQKCLEYLEQTDPEDLATLRAKCRDKFLEKLLQKESISLGEVIFVEKDIISQQRLNRLVEKPSDSLDNSGYYGIAISGGGIRSASFGLGILQALCKSNKLKYFDYMSAVSGGGYIASCLTWFNRKKRDDPKFQKGNSTTPFCKLFNTDAKLDKKIAGYKDKTSLNYLRQNGKYLTPTKDLNTLALVATIAGNAFVAAAVYFSCLLVVFWLLKGFNFYEKIPTSMLETFNSFLWLEQITWLKLSLHLLVYFLLLLLVFSMLNTYRVEKNQEANILEGILAEKYKKRRNLQICIGKTVSIIVVIAIFATLPDAWHLSSLIYQYLVLGSTTNGTDLELGGISVGVVLGVIGAIYQFFRQNIPEKKYSIITDIRIILTAMILIYSVLLFAWKVSDKYDSLFELLLYSGNSKEAWLIAIVPWLFVMSGWVIDINYFGIRQMYRDRLMEIFLPNMSIFDENNENPFRWSPATNADQADIQDMCGPEDFGPYLILNANAVLMNSKNAKYRNRGGDNYMLSSKFIGCSATGWSHITQLKYPAPLTLGAAMSISGAAVNPHAGVGGKGLTRGRLVSMTLGFLNIRLGYWFENPGLAAKNKWKKLLNRPNLLFSGIQGVLGIGIDENHDYIELTDGGHFDNTGLYELFRRKLKVIVLSQAGADPDFTVDDIGNAIQKARADFGAHVYFVPDFGLNELVPGIVKAEGLAGKIELSKNPYAIALIKYAANEFGVLIIIKTVLTKGLSADLYSYKLSNKSFPNQSTTDQFFSEDQFEAYRELGFGLCYKMLNGEFGENLSWSKSTDLVEAVRLKSLLAYKPDIDVWGREDCLGFLGNDAGKLSGVDLKSAEILQNECKKKILEDKGV